MYDFRVGLDGQVQGTGELVPTDSLCIEDLLYEHRSWGVRRSNSERARMPPHLIPLISVLIFYASSTTL
jgi:hypothetical protein